MDDSSLYYVYCPSDIEDEILNYYVNDANKNHKISQNLIQLPVNKKQLEMLQKDWNKQIDNYKPKQKKHFWKKIFTK